MLTHQGKERLLTRLERYRKQLQELEEYFRQQSLCKCDFDRVCLQEARKESAQLEQEIAEFEGVLERAALPRS